MDRRLRDLGIGTLRFDQYGSGQSGGTPIDRRFDDWVDLTLQLVHRLQREGHQVSVLGNSMGGSAALMAASRDTTIAGCVAWVPGLERGAWVERPEPYLDEAGERMDWDYWRQHAAANVLARLGVIEVPTLVLLATEDELQSAETRQEALALAGPAVEVQLLSGYRHGRWTEAQTTYVIERSGAFLSARRTP
jgi:alpha-beta hydrolase superfamily lysophospholipase